MKVFNCQVLKLDLKVSVKYVLVRKSKILIKLCIVVNVVYQHIKIVWVWPKFLNFNGFVKVVEFLVHMVNIINVYYVLVEVVH